MKIKLVVFQKLRGENTYDNRGKEKEQEQWDFL